MGAGPSAGGVLLLDEEDRKMLREMVEKQIETEKKMWRKLAKGLHPDHGGSEEGFKVALDTHRARLKMLEGMRDGAE